MQLIKNNHIVTYLYPVPKLFALLYCFLFIGLNLMAQGELSVVRIKIDGKD
jgi:hypothetical protein